MFHAHVELLQSFLAHRKEIVEKIQGLLNAQRKPVSYLQDHPLLSHDFEDCFFALAPVAADRARLSGQLEAAHRASGFRPRQMPGLHNDLIHPAEMTIRAFYCWRQTRWPGRNGRVRYAQTLFNVYLLRCLELLSMRVFDAGSGGAGDRLGQVQAVLDALWSGAPTDQPVLVRDARWLIPLAQSPTTDELAAYFEVAQHVAETLAPNDRLEIQKAGVRMIGGHLRSQIRHYCIEDDVSFDDHSVVLRTRTSNALDFALLIQGLVPLLDAYENARRTGETRLELASAICQGISPDPELFLNRLDLLGAHSMIEHLFIATDHDGHVDYTPMGRRHLELLRRYEAKIGRLAKALHDDCSHFRPVDGSASPYGVIYGTPSNLTEHMALRAIHPDAVTGLGVEDVFIDADPDGEKLAWVNGWRKLPHIASEVQRLHEYPHEFAAALFDRIEQELCRCASDAETGHARRTGRLVLVVGDDRAADSAIAEVPALSVRYIGSSDPKLLAAGKAISYDEIKLLRDRQEGHFLLSFQTVGGWVAIRKDLLTEVLGEGHDVRIVDLPSAAARVLELMCPDMATQARMPPSMVKA